MPLSNRFELVSFENGSISVKDTQSSETMHSRIGPWAEAHEIYIHQADLPARLGLNTLHAPNTKDPLVIYDIGLGIAANSIATLETFSQLEKRPMRNLRILSFETDPSGLEFGLAHLDALPFLKPYQDILRALLKKGEVWWETHEGRNFVHWTLHAGDFREKIRQIGDPVESPELIYYDLYSSKDTPELWGLGAFQLCFEAASRKQKQGLPSRLITYSSSTSVRAALLVAGFHVGYGVSTLAKKQTTVATTGSPSLLSQPLGREWLEHWKRSSKPWPVDLLEADYSWFAERLERSL